MFSKPITLPWRHLPQREDDLRQTEDGQDSEQGNSRQQAAYRPGDNPEKGDDVVGNEEAMEVSGAPRKGCQENGVQSESLP